jgi:hypothetical protein
MGREFVSLAITIILIGKSYWLKRTKVFSLDPSVSNYKMRLKELEELLSSTLGSTFLKDHK